MFRPEQIVYIYDNVLRKEEFNYKISQTDMKIAIRNMTEAYKPDDTNWYRQEVDMVANYDDPAHRCAYLHKYAPLHTFLVQDIFYRALIESHVLINKLFCKYGIFNICSLGGGPGSDIIGVVSACQPFSLLNCSVKIVDLMSEWENTFNLTIEDLLSSNYGNVSLNLSAEYFNCSYMKANLLKAMDTPLREIIQYADLITMVKFVSAAACIDTENMIKNIFNRMKVGALVLYIDNAAGGYREMISRLAEEFSLVTIYEPTNHLHYSEPAFKVKRFGYGSCFETKVSVKILMKVFYSTSIHNQSSTNQYSQYLHLSRYEENLTTLHNRKKRKRRIKKAYLLL